MLPKLEPRAWLLAAIFYIFVVVYVVVDVVVYVVVLQEALNKGGDGVDLDSLMADLCSIEQELSTVGKPNSGKGVPGDAKLRQKPPAGRSGSTKGHGGAGGSR